MATKPNKIIKASTLKRLGACPDQLQLFKKLFGKEVKLTKKLVLQHWNEFDIDWAVYILCDSSAQLKYAKIEASAWEEYYKTGTIAWEEYDKTRALAFYELYNGAIHD